MPDKKEYIELESLIDWLNYVDGIIADGTVEAPTLYKQILTDIKNFPTADVEEVRQGKWVPRLAINGHIYYDCSICGRQVDTMRKQNPREIFPYCHCGAKMDGGNKVG